MLAIVEKTSNCLILIFISKYQRISKIDKYHQYYILDLFKNTSYFDRSSAHTAPDVIEIRIDEKGKIVKKILPGILITVAIAFCAKIASNYIPHIGGVSLAIILGIVVGNVCPFGDKFNPGITYCEKKVLIYAIILMGFKLQLLQLQNMGASVFLIVLPTIAVTITAGLLLGKFLGYSSRFSLLMGVGNAVCGSSAIAAVAPAIQAEDEEIGVSIGIVNLLGTAGIFLMPIFVHLLSLSDVQSSYMIGGVLQAIGQVVAAGFSINDNVGDTATLIKMLRVLMIGPVVMIVSILNKNTTGSTNKKNFIPGYIIGFVFCSIIASIFHADTIILPHLRLTAKLFLMVAMAAVGMKIRFANLVTHGPKALIFGCLTTTIQTAYITAIVLTCL